MQRAHMDKAGQLGQREVHVIDMKMNDVELVGALRELLQASQNDGQVDPGIRSCSGGGILGRLESTALPSWNRR